MHWWSVCYTFFLTIESKLFKEYVSIQNNSTPNLFVKKGKKIIKYSLKDHLLVDSLKLVLFGGSWFLGFLDAGNVYL